VEGGGDGFLKAFRAGLLLIGLLLLVVVPVSAYDSSLQQLAVQYDLSKAITVYEGILQKGWYHYGSVVIPKDWHGAYLIISPEKSGTAVVIRAKVNGYYVIRDANLCGPVSVDITNIVQPGERADIYVYATRASWCRILVAPPNPLIENLNETKEQIKKTNKNLELLKYALIGLGCVILVSAIYLATQRRRGS